ncbi:inner centromere protein A isoform X2 [Corythoichthys intestinalis]|uniref:inner centromere protein A isoform X2 n=1 Tax=Corythoichthys intestinalis TaxID=161448 RepID=UPI0025A66A02|nr:inner centromere protein A isoform X2 [Corythoichthys intestinalis]
MNSSLAPFLLGAVYQKNRRLFPDSLTKLRKLIEEKLQIVSSDVTEDQQGVAFAEDTRGGPWKFAVLSKELTSHLQQLQTETEHELNNIKTQSEEEGKTSINSTSGHRMLEKNETNDMHTPECSPTQSPLSPQQTATKEAAKQNWTASQRKAGLSNLQRAGSVKDLISKFSGPESDLYLVSSPGLYLGAERAQKFTSSETVLSLKSKSSPTVISRDCTLPTISVTPPCTAEIKQTQKDAGVSQKTASIDCPVESSSHKTDSNKAADSGRDSVADSGMGSEPESESNKQSDSLSEEEPSTPRTVPPSPKYQLFLENDLKSNGLSSSSSKIADGQGGGGSLGENGPRLSRWETTRSGPNNFQGSMESIASRDLESDRGFFVEGPRVFNSPYSMNVNASADFNTLYRTNEFKSGISPATSELNLHTFNSRSNSPVFMSGPTFIPPRTRYSAYDSLLKRRNDVPAISTQYSMRAATLGGLSRKDFIEELTKQLDNCQKRNQFLEAESVEMEKERNQIRFEMRGLLVNNEDLLRTNTQLANEMKRMREQMIELERTNQALAEQHRGMEIEVKQARDMMVEANTQEYAFGFLEQTLKNKIQDAEESLEKQTQHSQTLAEKLWLAERQLEDLEVDKDSKSKKTSELSTTIQRLELELAEALQISSQSTAELNLQQKLRQDAQLRMEELEESLLEKEQELQRHQALIIRLQGDVSGKLIDKEQTLEEEIQLRERLQLQCKQVERTVDDLQMELQTTIQAKDDLAKQLKQAQEKLIDLETDVEELHDSEQRWAAKNKRAIDQTEQLQLKLIQEKDLNDQLESEKAIIERQFRELRLEMDEIQSVKPSEDVISKTETRMKELENLLRTEERSKAVLMNTIGKLERRVNELSDQMEEEHRIATEQKDLMAQRIRSLKRQLNEAEEEASRRDAQLRHTQRELADERESNGRLQRQLLDQHLLTKRKETLTIRQTLDNLRLDLSVDDEDEQVPQRQEVKEEKAPEQISKVTEV